MAKDSAQKISVNLLSPDAFSQSIVGKLLLWALSIGRYIVIFTELIVILSFLSRFKLDRDLTDLNSSIAKQMAIIESYGDLEPKVRRLQSQLDLIRQKSTSSKALSYLAFLEKITPIDTRLKQLSLTPESVQLSGIALSPQSLGNLAKLIASDKTLENVQLGEIKSSKDGIGLEFSLRADLVDAASKAKSAAKKTPVKEEE